MINREDLGAVDGGGGWPTISVPMPVLDGFRRLAARCSDIETRDVGRGYHVAGWSYIEVEIRAVSLSRAWEEAERLNAENMWSLQDKLIGEEAFR